MRETQFKYNSNKNVCWAALVTDIHKIPGLQPTISTNISKRFFFNAKYHNIHIDSFCINKIYDHNWCNKIIHYGVVLTLYPESPSKTDLPLLQHEFNTSVRIIPSISPCRSGLHTGKCCIYLKPNKHWITLQLQWISIFCVLVKTIFILSAN
jgi:hypothetical protein